MQRRTTCHGNGSRRTAGELDLDVMVVPVVVQRDPVVGLLDAIAQHAADRATEVLDLEVIDRLAMAVVHGDAAPAPGAPRLYRWLVDLEPDPERGLGDELVHPARRAGVPGPATAPGVLRVGVDAGRAGGAPA